MLHKYSKKRALCSPILFSLIIFLVLSSLIVDTVFGTSPSRLIKATTDKRVYSNAEPITISGQVDQSLLDRSGYVMNIIIRYPNGEDFKSDHIVVNLDGSFSYSFEMISDVTGYYTFFLSFPDHGIGYDFIFISGPYELTMGDQIYHINYHLDTGMINSISVNEKEKSLTILTDSISQLTLELPRALIDSVEGEEDTSFIVLIDGKQADFEQIQSSKQTRALFIDLPCGPGYGNLCGKSEIQIVGTRVVPEFSFILIATLLGLTIAISLSRLGALH